MADMMTLEQMRDEMRAWRSHTGFEPGRLLGWADAIDAAIKQREQDKKDAARYRWLRDKSGRAGSPAMADLETLRPEIRDAVDSLDKSEGIDFAWLAVRAELLRRNREISELRSICAATYQAAGCYGLPERFKDALSNGATGERIHDVDVDHLLPVFPTDWVERAERAEAELAVVKARIAEAPVYEIPLSKPKSEDGWACVIESVKNERSVRGKRVRLVVEE